MSRPNILFVMTDQQRFDTIAALGNSWIHTPNLDRLVKRGAAFTNAYSTCPVCIPARYTLRTGCEPRTTRWFANAFSPPMTGQAEGMEERCGPYLARVMRNRGYRTFGVGKFHSVPWDEDLGYEIQCHSEELYENPEQRRGDAYASWMAREHPEFAHLEMLMGERTEMYYVPQTSPMSASQTVEGWASDRAVELIRAGDGRPYFGFVSFIGPHPPFAPPIPFNRMYDPDRMPDAVQGDKATDHMDEQIPWMNHAMWAENVSPSLNRILKARYYGEISYIDSCLGRILNAVESLPDASNTLICFFSDHGDHLGNHHAWQKESFFEDSTRIPFLLSWPGRIVAGTRCEELVCLTDLFGIATHASGEVEPREGMDVLGMLAGKEAPRDCLLGCHSEPGSPFFKAMLRQGVWKYIFMANGGREQLFDLRQDPREACNRAMSEPGESARLREKLIQSLDKLGSREALDHGRLKTFPFRQKPRKRAMQFDRSRGINGFPENPGDLLRGSG